MWSISHNHHRSCASQQVVRAMLAQVLVITRGRSVRHQQLLALESFHSLLKRLLLRHNLKLGLLCFQWACSLAIKQTHQWVFQSPLKRWQRWLVRLLGLVQILFCTCVHLQLRTTKKNVLFLLGARIKNLLYSLKISDGFYDVIAHEWRFSRCLRIFRVRLMLIHKVHAARLHSFNF